MKTMQRREGISLEYLVKKAQQGDGHAFIELMEANKQNMYKIARSYFSNEEDIADAIQDTIESCYKSLPYLDKTEYFRTWLTRILINKCIDIIKKNKRESPVDVFPEQGEICMDLRHCEFEELMRSLDEKYRTILLLYYGGIQGQRDRTASRYGGKYSKNKACKRAAEISGDMER